MSYDLFVFDPDEAPADRAEFLAWYRRTVRWEDTADTYEPANLTVPLLAFVHRFHTKYPSMNDLGPLPSPVTRGSVWSRLGKVVRNRVVTLIPASEGIDDSCFTDYTCARNALYLGFAWSQADAALHHCLKTAAQSGCGVYLASDTDGAILRTAQELASKTAAPSASHLQRKDAMQVLKQAGWTLKRPAGETIQFAHLVLEDRVLRADPQFDRTSLSWNIMTCSRQYLRACRAIQQNETLDFYPMRLSRHQVDLADVTAEKLAVSLQEHTLLARSDDLNVHLQDLLDLPISAPGNGPIRLLAAMACAGGVGKLEEMLANMRNGDRQGFVAYVNEGHIERACGVARHITGGG